MRSERLSLNRVDRQVSLLILLLIGAVVSCISLFSYQLSHADMLQTLEQQVRSIHAYADSLVTEQDFHLLNVRTDEESASYRRVKTQLETIRSITGVRYLYTAKENDAGELIYLVDGLDSQAEDFRHVGDPIEEEVHPQMWAALAGQEVLPDDIISTSWGKVFVCYFPIHGDRGQVVGVLGIELEAEHQYDTYLQLRIGSFVIGGVLLLFSTFISVVLFRRISNPTFRDLANSDYLTNCKNRNAFELDLRNLDESHRQEGSVLMSIDLNGLKDVNDRLGHQQGDLYIQSVAKQIEAFPGPLKVLYRVGGDEFALWVPAQTQRTADEFYDQLCTAFSARPPSGDSALPFSVSLSIGYALFDPEKDKGLRDTYQRADLSMYEQKRAYYQTREHDRRQSPRTEAHSKS